MSALVRGGPANAGDRAAAGSRVGAWARTWPLSAMSWRVAIVFVSWAPRTLEGDAYVSRETRRGSVVIVVKFGGTSLAGTERMRASARIVAAHRRDTSVVCVVSAMAGVTDMLLRTAQMATSETAQTTETTGTMTWRQMLTELRSRHMDALTGITAPMATAPLMTSLASRFDALWARLESDLAVLIAGTDLQSDAASAHAVAAFSGWGERLSVALFSAALAAEDVLAEPFDGEPVVMVRRAGTEATERDQDVPWERLAPSVAATRAASARRIKDGIAAGAVPVLPGYIGRTPGGWVTTLGRNGSDASAATLAAALDADAMYLYSDVPGVLRADPRAVPDAELLPALTYADAAEISADGAKVIHPDTVRPLAAAGIPLRLRSSFTPEAPGTDIGTEALVSAVHQHREAWLVAARPLSPASPLFHSPSEWLPGLVEVTAVFLRHADFAATEDDWLLGDPPEDVRGGISRPPTGRFSGALELLASEPRPVGLALTQRRISVAVPMEECAATQQRLYNVLMRATMRNHEQTGGDILAAVDASGASDDEMSGGERRRTS